MKLKNRSSFRRKLAPTCIEFFFCVCLLFPKYQFSTSYSLTVSLSICSRTAKHVLLLCCHAHGTGLRTNKTSLVNAQLKRARHRSVLRVCNFSLIFNETVHVYLLFLLAVACRVARFGFVVIRSHVFRSTLALSGAHARRRPQDRQRRCCFSTASKT